MRSVIAKLGFDDTGANQAANKLEAQEPTPVDAMCYLPPMLKILPLLGLAATGLLVAGCGAEEDVPATAAQLEGMPRLERPLLIDWESGRPAADVLAQGRILETLIPGKTPQVWKVKGGRKWIDPNGRLALTADEGAGEISANRRGLTLDAAKVDHLTFEVAVDQPGEVRIAVRTRPIDGGKASTEIHSMTAPEAGAHLIDIPVPTTGQIEGLGVAFAGGALGPIVASAAGFEVSASPIRGADGLHDTGLALLERRHEDLQLVRSESRRSLPAIFGRLQLGNYQAGGHPRLYLAAGLPAKLPQVHSKFSPARPRAQHRSRAAAWPGQSRSIRARTARSGTPFTWTYPARSARTGSLC